MSNAAAVSVCGTKRKLSGAAEPVSSPAMLGPRTVVQPPKVEGGLKERVQAYCQRVIQDTPLKDRQVEEANLWYAVMRFHRWRENPTFLLVCLDCFPDLPFNIVKPLVRLFEMRHGRDTQADAAEFYREIVGHIATQTQELPENRRDIKDLDPDLVLKIQAYLACKNTRNNVRSLAPGCEIG